MQRSSELRSSKTDSTVSLPAIDMRQRLKSHSLSRKPNNAVDSDGANEDSMPSNKVGRHGKLHHLSRAELSIDTFRPFNV